MKSRERRRRWGAEIYDDGVDFKVFAPRRKQVTLLIGGESPHTLVMDGSPEAGFQRFVPGLAAGTRYQFLLDDDARPYPDPVSRFQPEGPHGPSEVIDPAAYRWRDGGHPGVELSGQVLYELHFGTFTREGSYQSASLHLEQLAELGITLLELMPVADFPGRFGWGYDGVNLFAPSRLYGRPDDLRAFVDRAHALGMGVILDVVYNHLGPDGNYLSQFSDTFFSDAKTEWGDALNFDGDASAITRAFFLENAAYWIDEFHFDGLRVDATQQIFDRSESHILREITESARRAANPRRIVMIAENEPQSARLVRAPEEAGYGFDAIWSDDFHHAAHVAATGQAEAYYADTGGSPQELISAMKWGFLYQGQYYGWQGKPRGEPALDLSSQRFVLYLQNHDQVANSARGLRLHQLTSPARARALKVLLLLAPGTPMLFQGQEFDASSPFFYFADHHSEFAPVVRQGRFEFLRQFESLQDPAMEPVLPDPGAYETFARSKLDQEERAHHAEALALTRDLLRLRKTDPVFRAQRGDCVHGAVLGPEAFVLRFLGTQDGDRLLVVNLGTELTLQRVSEPLLAPPLSSRWQPLLSTEDPAYGGMGRPSFDTGGLPRLRGQAALALESTPHDAKAKGR